MLCLGRPCYLFLYCFGVQAGLLPGRFGGKYCVACRCLIPFQRFGYVVVLVVFCTVGMFVRMLESDAPASRMMHMFTTVAVAVVTCFVLWFPGMVNMRICLVVVEMAAIRVVDMMRIYVAFRMFVPDVPTPGMMFVLMPGFMMGFAMASLEPVVDLFFRFAMV